MRELFERVRMLILDPETAWNLIRAEERTAFDVLRRYGIIAALFPLTASIIGNLFSLHSIIFGLAHYILTFVVVFVIAKITDLSAPVFEGERSLVNAVKLVVYSWTPLWIAGCFAIVSRVPILGLPVGVLAGIAGIVYSIYLLYIGIPVMMKCPPEKTFVYLIVLCLSGVVLGAVFLGPWWQYP